MSDEVGRTVTCVYDGGGCVAPDTGRQIRPGDDPSGSLVDPSVSPCAWPLTCISYQGGMTGISTHYDRYGRRVGPAAPPLPPPGEPLPEVEPIERLFSHTFEFRLAGSEETSQSTALPMVPAGDRIVTAVSQVRTFVTRNGAPAPGTAVIGGVEVWTETLAETATSHAMLKCFARVSDFAAADLIVVQVDVNVDWARFASREERSKED